MSINQSLGQYYRNYASSRLIVKGGVVDAGQYLRSSHKTVFLLKEPSTADTGWTLPAHVHGLAAAWLAGETLGRQPTWWTTGLLAYGIANQFQKLPSPGAARRRAVGAGLMRIGATNLNILRGSPRSNDASLRQVATERRRRRLLVNELDSMSPDVIICGGTFWHASEALNKEGVLIVQPKVLLTRAGVPYYFALVRTSGSTAVLLDDYHPQFTKAVEDRYRLLRSMFTRLKKRTIFGEQSQPLQFG